MTRFISPEHTEVPWLDLTRGVRAIGTGITVLVTPSIQEIVAVIGSAAVEEEQCPFGVPCDFTFPLQFGRKDFWKPFIKNVSVDESVRLMADATIVM
jgi:hypothetical protein